MYIEFPADGVVLALDPAKRTGVAYGRPRGAPSLATVVLAHELDTTVEIFGRASSWFAGTLAEVKPHLIVIEQVIAPHELWGETQYRTTTITHGLFAIFAGLGAAQKIPVLEASIRTWRKYFLGRGNMRGDEAKRACVRLCRQLKWNDEHGNAPGHDAAEAAGVWAWGCAQVQPQNVRRLEPLFMGAPR